MRNESAVERKQLMVDVMEVLIMLVTPSECFLSFIEHYFEIEYVTKTICVHFCSHCRGDIRQVTGLFYKEALQSLLTTSFVPGTSLKYKGFIKTIK